MRCLVLLFCMIIAISIVNARSFRDLRGDEWGAGGQWNDESDGDSDDAVVIEPDDGVDPDGSVAAGKFFRNMQDFKRIGGFCSIHLIGVQYYLCATL